MRCAPADRPRTALSDDWPCPVDWLRDGAPWQQFWSFVPPHRPGLPAVKNAGWTKNAIDRFILARLEREGLQPSPEADRRLLIRRVSLDPGQTKRVTFALRVSDLKYWDTASSSWQVESGPVAIAVGPSSADLPLKDTMIVK